MRRSFSSYDKGDLRRDQILYGIGCELERIADELEKKSEDNG